jgi:hypothetical protein
MELMKQKDFHKDWRRLVDVDLTTSAVFVTGVSIRRSSSSVTLFAGVCRRRSCSSAFVIWEKLISWLYLILDLSFDVLEYFHLTF